MILGLLDRFRSDASDSERGDDCDGEPDGGDDPGTIWDLIPRWQYNVETGGSTREGQERAIAEVQAQAAAIEAAESADGDGDPPEPARDDP